MESPSYLICNLIKLLTLQFNALLDFSIGSCKGLSYFNLFHNKKVYLEFANSVK